MWRPLELPEGTPHASPGTEPRDAGAGSVEGCPISDDEQAYGTVRRFVDAVPSGSYLALSHTITNPAMPDVDAAVAFWNEHGTPKLTQRTPKQILRFFGGLELLEPGVVSCTRWRPEATPWGQPDEVAMFGGVGRKP